MFSYQIQLFRETTYSSSIRTHLDVNKKLQFAESKNLKKSYGHISLIASVLTEVAGHDIG